MQNLKIWKIQINIENHVLAKLANYVSNFVQTYCKFFFSAKKNIVVEPSMKGARYAS